MYIIPVHACNMLFFFFFFFDRKDPSTSLLMIDFSLNFDSSLVKLSHLINNYTYFRSSLWLRGLIMNNGLCVTLALWHDHDLLVHGYVCGSWGPTALHIFYVSLIWHTQGMFTRQRVKTEKFFLCRFEQRWSMKII